MGKKAVKFLFVCVICIAFIFGMVWLVKNIV